MAQFGRALRSGRRGRKFKSCHLDHNRTPILIQSVSGLVSVFFIRKSLFNGIYRYVTLYFSGLFAFTQFFFQNQTYRGEHYSIPSSAFLILTARYSLVGRSILKRPLKLPTFSTVMFHVSIMSTVYILLSSI